MKFSLNGKVKKMLWKEKHIHPNSASLESHKMKSHILYETEEEIMS